jgi:hypothetical protein
MNGWSDEEENWRAQQDQDVLGSLPNGVGMVVQGSHALAVQEQGGGSGTRDGQVSPPSAPQPDPSGGGRPGSGPSGQERVGGSVVVPGGIRRKRKSPAPAGPSASVVRGQGRANPRTKDDNYGCEHMGLGQIAGIEAWNKASWIHYAKPGHYLAGKLCIECGEPADGEEVLQRGGGKGSVMHYCEEGTRVHFDDSPEVGASKCTFCICAVGCLAKRMERMEREVGPSTRGRRRRGQRGGGQQE